MRAFDRHGFTLIEISIVLVIIGLIVGGILVGRDLIVVATIRSQVVSQFEKYNTAVRTFQGKYGYLPGDIPAAPASQFGFADRSGWTLDGLPYPNGNGLIEGPYSGGGGDEGGGEPILFWKDLADANLTADGMANAAFGIGDCIGSGPDNWVSAPCFPAAKLSKALYLYVWSGGLDGNDGQNYYSISQANGVGSGSPTVESLPGLTVFQAYGIDQKMDDGMPQSGSVQAYFFNVTVTWAPNAATADSTTCFDTTSNQYSLLYANNPNCALTLRFQ